MLWMWIKGEIVTTVEVLDILCNTIEKEEIGKG